MDFFGPFPNVASEYPIAVAVSGGADSLCLALLAHQWRRNCVALIVDHGLRRESAQESATTQATLNQHGMVAHVLTLKNLSVGRGLQARARAARYDILTAWCRENGALDLLIGHHWQDQAETWLLRKAQQSGARGLASMAASRFEQDVRILRPLLTIAPERLRATLRMRGVEWVEDPSNRDARFSRVQVRQQLTITRTEAAVEESRSFGRMRTQSEAAHVMELDSVMPHPFGFIKITGVLPSAPTLGRIWQGVAGAQWPVNRRVIERVVRCPQGLTYGGVWFFCRHRGAQGNSWYVVREPSAAREVIRATKAPVPAGIVWDGRWRLRSPLPPGFEIRRLGRAASRFKSRSLPSRLIAALPAVWDGPDLVALPALHMCERVELKDVGFHAWRGVPVTDASIWWDTPRN